MALDTEGCVEFLSGLAGEGPVLELGIGTGRVALPLSTRGLEVHGVDASEAMVAALRAKPGGDRLPIVIGDFADVPVDGLHSLIFVVFNTFFALLTQEDQVRCFQRVGQHLSDDGVFVIQAFIPDLARFDRGQRMETLRLGLDSVHFEASRYEAADQRVHSQHVMLEGDRVRMTPIEIRFAWPSELDLMARLANMRLRERWANWRREPFGSSSKQHVSVYEPDRMIG